MLELQRYLREHSLDQLKLEYAVGARRHTRYPHLILLKYSQIESPMTARLVQESRGIILDESDDWRVVSFPYTKFFNWGEPNAAPLDWATARAYDKLDGSLMTLYHYRGEWHVASSGVPCASRAVTGCEATLGELFWGTWKSLGYGLPDDPTHCFMFELMTPHNRVVCRYDEPRLVLHGVRSLDTFQEEEPEPHADRCGWECVRFTEWGDIDAVLEAAAALDPMKNEGFVVRDARFNRVKVKGSAYVSLHQITNNMTEKAMLDVVRRGEGAELLAYFPQYTALHDRLKEACEAFYARVDETYQQIAHHESQKEFALHALRYPYSWVLFNLRARKFGSVRENLGAVPVDKVQEALRQTGLLPDEELLGGKAEE